MFILSKTRNYLSRILPIQNRQVHVDQEPSVKQDIYTYIISSHGVMFSDISKTNYYAIDISKNIELYTFTDIGNIFGSYCNTHFFDTTCDSRKQEYKDKILYIDVPMYKYKYISNKSNKFPELAFCPEITKPTKPYIRWYSGIIHCIPHEHRNGNFKAKEIIYSIDAMNTKSCDCKEIPKHIKKTEPYDCEKNYSTYYRDQLARYNYDPSAADINKCGPILLSEAINLIKDDCLRRYNKQNSIIKIYIHACLTCLKINASLDCSNISMIDGWENIKKKIDKQNTVTNLRTFQENSIRISGTDVTKTYGFSFNNKNFDIVIYENKDNSLYSYISSEFDRYTSSEIAQRQREQGITIDILNYLLGKLRKYLVDAINKYIIKYSYLPENTIIDLTKIKINSTGNIDQQIVEEIYKQLEKIIKEHNHTTQTSTHQGGRKKKQKNIKNIATKKTKKHSNKKTKKQKLK